MLIFLKEYWFLFSSIIIPVLTSLATYFIGKHKGIKKREKQMIEDMEKLKEGICTLQRNSLYKTCEDYLEKGCCSFNAKQTINSLYDSYHALGGDSFITDMVAKVIDLPLKVKEEVEA